VTQQCDVRCSDDAVEVRAATGDVLPFFAFFEVSQSHMASKVCIPATAHIVARECTM
jgi:hypothetical protein